MYMQLNRVRMPERFGGRNGSRNRNVGWVMIWNEQYTTPMGG